MLSLTKAILGTTKGIITVLSGQLTNHIHSTITNLNSLVETIYCGQLARFEHVKEKVCKEVKSFEERLKTMVGGTHARIITEMSLIKGKLEEHREYVREKLKEYVKKIGSDLANLKRWDFQYVHNDLYEFEYRLDQIEGIVQGRGYRQAVHNLWKNFVRARGERLSDSQAFANFVQKLKDFQRKKSEICGQIETIRGKINVIRSKLNILQLKIPNIDEKEYKTEWRLRNKTKDFKVGPKSLMPAINLMNRQIQKVAEEFKEIQKKISPLQESIKPFEKHIEAQIVTDIKGTITDPSFELDKVIDRVAKLGVDVVNSRARLDNALRIHGYIRATDPSVILKYEKPTLGGLEKIDDFIPVISKNIAILKSMDSFISPYFRRLITKHVLPFISDDIFGGSLWLKEDISSKGKKLRAELEKYIATLESIKSIYNELNEIKKIADGQDKAMNGTVSSNGLGSSSLEKIKDVIEAFVKIGSNIDTIVGCFTGKEDELSHIKDNVHQLKWLKLDLIKLKFSIYNDIMFARMIEKIRKQFDSLKQEAEDRFGKVGFLIGYLITNIEFIMNNLGSICCIIKSICCMKSGLSDLGKLKPNLDHLKNYLERLGQCNKATDGHLVILNQNISDLQEYMGKLCSLESRIKGLEMKTIRLPIIELFPELLFTRFCLDFMIKCHTLHQKINRSIKSALRKIGLCRFVLGINKFHAQFAGIWVSCLLEQIETASGSVKKNISKVELSVESVIICFLKCSNKLITNNTIKSTKGMLTRGNQVYNNELANQ